MKISDGALSKIKNILELSPEKLPRIVLKKGGCAGNLLVLVLEKPEEMDKLIIHDGVTFAIEDNVKQFVNKIEIELKSDLGDEIVVRVADMQTCRCGKSFKMQQI